MEAEQACTVCGEPERPKSPQGRMYRPPENTDYICGTCVQKDVGMGGIDALDFKRGYIRALFLWDERWINSISKYWMIIPGNPLNPRHIKKDLALKERLADQVHPDTYQQRKVYFQAWLNAKCCADDCDQYCDECHGIKFESVPYRLAKGFDADARRFMGKYHRFWLKSEQDKAIRELKHDNQRKVSNRKDHDVIVRVRGGESPERSGLFSEQAQITGNPFEGQEEMFLRTRRGTMVTCQSD